MDERARLVKDSALCIEATAEALGPWYERNFPPERER